MGFWWVFCFCIGIFAILSHVTFLLIRTVDGGFPTVNEPKTLVDHAKNSSVIPYYDAHPIEEFEKKVTAAGGKVLKPKHPEPFGVISECEDTEGNYFVLYEVPSM